MKNDNLRSLATKRIKEGKGFIENVGALSNDEVKKVIHELQVHQVELEMQNDELQKIRKDLDRARLRYFELYELAPVGYLVMSDLGVIIESNLTAANLLGVKRSVLQNTKFSKYIYYEDQDIFYVSSKKLHETNKPQTYNIRLKRKDNQIIYANIQVSCVVEFGESLCKLVITDRTKQQRMLDQIVESETRYLELFENLEAGIVLHSPTTEIINANTAASKMLGLSIEEMTGKITGDPYWKFEDMSGNVLSIEDYPVNIIINTLKPLKNYILGIIKDDGEVTWVSVNGLPRFNKSGNLKEVVINFINITNQIDRERELEYAANHDHLTSLYNRRFYENTLQKYNVKSKLPLTIIMADINGLKLVNDAFGHASGDELLIACSEIMRNSIRKTDIVARVGGDEFAIILPNSDEKQAEIIIEDIIIESSKVFVESIPLSISFGYATKHTELEKIQNIERTSEDTMYRQKLTVIPSMRSGAIETILKTLNEKDLYSEQHSRNVAKYCTEIAKAIGFEKQDISSLATAGLLHDIGKIIIPLNLINKNGDLLVEEYNIIKTHSAIGFRILNSISNLREISEVVLCHHERWDGLGYPKGIKGEDIPLKSRIISIADAFDAMTTRRTYKTKLTKEEALEEIIRNSGTQFDPNLVISFKENFDSITK